MGALPTLGAAGSYKNTPSRISARVLEAGTAVRGTLLPYAQIELAKRNIKSEKNRTPQSAHRPNLSLSLKQPACSSLSLPYISKRSDLKENWAKATSPITTNQDHDSSSEIELDPTLGTKILAVISKRISRTGSKISPFATSSLRQASFHIFKNRANSSCSGTAKRSTPAFGSSGL